MALLKQSVGRAFSTVLVTGEVIEVNESLEDEPEKVNEDPYGDGWLYKVKLADAGELDGLMDSAAYAEHVAAEE